MIGIKNKFVLVENEIILGRVTFHKELHTSPLGGGMWYFHKEQNKIILYGDSNDFGPVSKQQVYNANIQGPLKHINNLKVIFDERGNHQGLEILQDHLGKVEGTKCYNECDFIK